MAAKAANSNVLSSKPSGEVRCGQGWDFRKATLIKGQCGLKAVL
jgi:hypothetical protein